VLVVSNWQLRSVSAGVGDNNDKTRRHNLSIILTMLHHGGAQARAQLTRQSGLSRSTIAALAVELAELDLAYQTEPGDSGMVGRPSPIVHPNNRVAAIVVNPDVDAITIGLVGLGGQVHKRIRYPTASIPTVRETVNVVAAVLEGMRNELESTYRIVGVGVAVPGLVNAEEGIVMLAPHLRWRNEPLAELVSKALGYPVKVANDASLGTVSESLFGVGRGVQDLVYLNGSASGIGGGVLVGGSLVRGAQGYAGELGHSLINSVGIKCHCGKLGCLETEVNLGRLLQILKRDSLDLDELDNLLAEGNDPAVRSEVNRQLDVLGRAIGNFISVFNPESFVLGGFLGSLYDANPKRLHDAVRASTFGSLGESVRIDRAQLRSRLLMVGAAELVFGELLADPAGTQLSPSSEVMSG
jgi:predicted NBD/HSP70 family sugar kinase